MHYLSKMGIKSEHKKLNHIQSRLRVKTLVQTWMRRSQVAWNFFLEYAGKDMVKKTAQSCKWIFIFFLCQCVSESLWGFAAAHSSAADPRLCLVGEYLYHKVAVLASRSLWVNLWSWRSSRRSCLSHVSHRKFKSWLNVVDKVFMQFCHSVMSVHRLTNKLMKLCFLTVFSLNSVFFDNYLLAINI